MNSAKLCESGHKSPSSVARWILKNLASAKSSLLHFVRLHKHRNRMVHISHLEPSTTVGAVELEAAEQWQQPEPAFILNLSGQPTSTWFQKDQIVHATYFRRFPDSVLFGPNHIINSNGEWYCEAYTQMRQYTDYFMTESFDNIFPGAKPQIIKRGSDIYCTLRNLNFSDIEFIDEPIFLATPLEPDNWGRWIASVIPKIMFYKKQVNGRKIMCRLGAAWQEDIFQTLGVDCTKIIRHDPGKTYFCSDLATTHYSDTDMHVSKLERPVYAEIAEMCLEQTHLTFGERIFLSRATQSKRYPNYRVLQNEEELICKLKKIGFSIVEPENYSFKEQVALFARAKCVVGLGGSALYTTMFCRPGTKIVTIESSEAFIRHHSRLISSVDHVYGVIFGKQDLSDPTFIHKRWTVDVESVAASLTEFL
jgi:hypothetical protein